MRLKANFSLVLSSSLSVDVDGLCLGSHTEKNHYAPLSEVIQSCEFGYIFIVLTVILVLIHKCI